MKSVTQTAPLTRKRIGDCGRWCLLPEQQWVALQKAYFSTEGTEKIFWSTSLKIHLKKLTRCNKWKPYSQIHPPSVYLKLDAESPIHSFVLSLLTLEHLVIPVSFLHTIFICEFSLSGLSWIDTQPQTVIKKIKTMLKFFTFAMVWILPSLKQAFCIPKFTLWLIKSFTTN